MLNDELRVEAERQFTICNACRYCEGLCSVFPAMELRTAFTGGDVGYLANLCHDCRACAHACPFSPPHELAVDLPALLSTARVKSFEQHARPQFLWRLLNRPKALFGVVLGSIAIVAVLALSFGNAARLVHASRGEGAFYRVIAYMWLVIPATMAGLLSVTAILAGLTSALREDGRRLRRLFSLSAAWQALVDVLGLANLTGGGGGCYSDDGKPRAIRRNLHFLVFYGFAAMFAATIAAAIEQDFFDVRPPYRLMSAPVLLGTIGGIATIAGCIGFLLVAFRSRDRSTVSEPQRISRLFNAMLIATAASGLLLLVFRSTAVMGPLLVVHLGLVGGFFLTLPYGKFVHSAYRYAALVRYHGERRSPAPASGDRVPQASGRSGRRDEPDRRPLAVKD